MNDNSGYFKCPKCGNNKVYSFKKWFSREEFINKNTLKTKWIFYENEKKVLEIPVGDFVAMYKLLYNKIINAKESAFSVDEAEAFMTKIRCKRLKALSTDKKDIVIRIHDFRTGMQPTLGFSIKSMLGKDSTLFNYSDATNITYKVMGNIDDDIMSEVNAIDDQLLRMDKIYEYGLDLAFVYYNSEERRTINVSYKLL